MGFGTICVVVSFIMYWIVLERDDILWLLRENLVIFHRNAVINPFINNSITLCLIQCISVIVRDKVEIKLRDWLLLNVFLLNQKLCISFVRVNL